jgi:hypothetical protein
MTKRSEPPFGFTLSARAHKQNHALFGGEHCWAVKHTGSMDPNADALENWRLLCPPRTEAKVKHVDVKAHRALGVGALIGSGLIHVSNPRLTMTNRAWCGMSACNCLDYMCPRHSTLLVRPCLPTFFAPPFRASFTFRVRVCQRTRATAVAASLTLGPESQFSDCQCFLFTTSCPRMSTRCQP